MFGMACEGSSSPLCRGYIKHVEAEYQSLTWTLTSYNLQILIYKDQIHFPQVTDRIS